MRDDKSPLDDLTFDVMTVLQNKAKALEAYEKYLADAEEDDEAREAFEEMRQADAEHVRTLKEILARRLDEDLGFADDEEEEDEEYDFGEDEEAEDDLDSGEHRGEEIAHAHAEPPPRRGESSQRR